MWVTLAGDHVVIKMALDGSVLDTFQAGTLPASVVFDGENIWVGDFVDHTVTKLRASDGHLVGIFNVGHPVSSLVFDGVNIWMAGLDNTVTKL